MTRTLGWVCTIAGVYWFVYLVMLAMSLEGMG